MEKRICLTCGGEFNYDQFDENAEFCSKECERTAQWAYLILRCNGNVEVVPCEYGAVDLDDEAKKVIGCAEIDATDLLPLLSIDELWMDSDLRGCVLLTNAHDRSDYVEDYAGRANRAVWGLDKQLVYGDVVLVRNSLKRSQFLNSRNVSAPIPFSVANRIAEFVSVRNPADDDWIPRSYPPVGADLKCYLKEVLVKKTCAVCGKEFEIDAASSDDAYFCSDECERSCTQWGYVVLKCDGTIDVVECLQTTSLYDIHADYKGDWWHYRCRWDRKPVLFDVGEMYRSNSERCFDPAALAVRVNKVVWDLEGELVLGDVIVAGRYNYHEECKRWMPLAVANKVAETLRRVLVAIAPRPMSESLRQGVVVKNGNPQFFERCCRRGLFGWGLLVLLQFTDKNDRELYEAVTFERHDGERDCEPIVETENGLFAGMRCNYNCLEEDFPINETHECLIGRAMNAAVKSGRVRIYAGFIFQDSDEFEKFRQEEAALEGRDWKVLFAGKTSPQSEKETVLVGTSLKVPWLDLTPCKTIDLCGDFKK